MEELYSNFSRLVYKKKQSCNGRGAKGVGERDKEWASVLLVPFHNATCAWLNKTHS